MLLGGASMNDGIPRSVMLTAALVVIAGALKLASEVAVPIVLSVSIAFITAPLVFAVHRRGVPNALSVVLVLGAGALLIVPLVLILDSSAGQLAANAGDYQARVVELAGRSSEWLVQHGLSSAGRGEEAAIDTVGPALSAFGGALTRAGSLITTGLLVLLLSAFILFDAARLWNLVDRRFSRTEGDSLLNEISHEVNRYLAVKTATSATTGLLAGLACFALDVDLPLLWGLLAFLLNYIPTVGSFIAAIPPVLLALVMHGPVEAAILGAIYVAINTTIGSIIEPRVMGDAMGLSPWVVFTSLLVCGYLLGPVGAFLSVPAAMILKMALSNQERTEWLAELMGGKKAREPVPLPTGRLSMVSLDVPDDEEGE